MIDRLLTWLVSRVRYWLMERRTIRSGAYFYEKEGS